MKQSVSNLSDNYKINFDHSINSGQVFLWEKIDTKWYGIDGKKVLVLENSQKFKKNMKLFLKNKKFVTANVNLFNDKLISFRLK